MGRTKDRSLWNTTGHLACWWHMSLYNNLLGPLVEKVFNPMVGIFRDTIVVKLEEKSLVVHLVEGLGKVEQDGVSLSSFIKLCCQVIQSGWAVSCRIFTYGSHAGCQSGCCCGQSEMLFLCRLCVPLPEASHRPVSRRWFGSFMGS